MYFFGSESSRTPSDRYSAFTIPFHYLKTAIINRIEDSIETTFFFPAYAICLFFGGQSASNCRMRFFYSRAVLFFVSRLCLWALLFG